LLSLSGFLLTSSIFTSRGARTRGSDLRRLFLMKTEKKAHKLDRSKAVQWLIERAEG